MGFIAVGNDGLILRLGGRAREHDKPFAPGIAREKYDGSKNLNGVARTTIPGRDFALALAVGDDGVALIRTTTGEWKRALTGTGRDLNAVSIAPGTDTAWAVGDEGTILRTTDGGEHWSIQSSSTSRHLRAVFAVDETTAWVVGDEGTLNATSDAGATWKHKSSGAEGKHLRGICRGDRLVAAVGDDGKLVYRDNNNWNDTKITGKHLRAAALHSNGSLLIVVGDDGWIGMKSPLPSFSTGSNWKSPDVTSKHLRGVARQSPQWAIVGDGEFLTSDDHGASWQRHGAGSLKAVC
jgi:photosystem II stability/assembly factor-like uncharacterized protein